MDAVKTLLIVIPLGLILAMGTAQAQPTQFQSGTSLTAAELADEEGRGFRRISPTELELTSGRGFGTDLDYRQLSDIVGRGFISQLSPNEIRQINARGLLPSPQQIELMTMNLVQTTIKGITIVIDKSKFTSAELTVFLEEWEKYLSSL
ncbi:MAG: hypothetical protein ACLFPD_05550 [Desulfosudaceae bacterium]